MRRHPIALIAAFGLLAGCSALSALSDAAEPRDAFQLQAPLPGPVARGTPRAEDVIVEIPSASGAIDTDRILVRPSATQVQYLPDATWIEPVPQMIQSALVDGLERSGGFRFVGRKPLGSSGDVAVISNIVTFDAALEPGSKAATIEVRLALRLVREEDVSVLASRTFAASDRAEDTSTEALVAAYDRATSRVVGEALDWVLRQRGVRLAASGNTP